MKKLFSTTCIPADAEHTKGSLIHRFVRDEEGNVTILSITLIAIGVLLAGVSWDLNNYEYHRVKLQQIADRAVLAAADLDQTLPREEVVRDYFTKMNYPDIVTSVSVEEGLNYRTVGVNVGGVIQTNTVRGDYTGGVKWQGTQLIAPLTEEQKEVMTDEQISAYEQMRTNAVTDGLRLHAFAEAEERVNNVEISLVLDISGSMGWGGKMGNLRDAANTFVDAVINDSTEDLVSISIIPYAEHVSAGPNIMSELNVNQVHNYSHCVDFDDDDFNTTSIGMNAYGTPKSYEQMQHFYWGSTNDWNNRSNPACRNGTYDDIEAFSQDTVALKNKIGRLSPNGNTSIFLGMKWAAALLDPSFQPVNARLASNGHTDITFEDRPVAFDDNETLKTVILMTDGENTSSKRINPSVYANTSHYAHWNNNNFDWWVNRNVYSSQRQYWSSSKYWTSFGDSLLNNICTVAKQNNIVIWSIGFEVSDRSADVMRNCASSPSHYFGVEGVEIKEAFTAIARQINQLRLTQ
ncbi:TadE/TadG family type IV pilus assembly protein [uncultured Sulfitobacter sp.]|uniref:TadE/TadG family type IV pilus assembly protein n=1 Tax=uncultured Sulfitobacter sp. TaxID=191468 RepID=UPI00261DD1E3|nr:TadE/TadG family type IV pilus assembly protein [uncultured Sulfitobacter sp.]